MELGVAVVGTLVKSILPKLLKVISEELGQLKLDAEFLKRELQLIQAFIRDKPSIGRYISNLERQGIAQIRCLADDIEECIDRFDVGKTTRRQFAREIGELKVRSKETREQLESYINLATSGSAPPSNEVPPPADCLVNMKDAEQELLALVQNNSEEKLKVISIVGLGGPGMTLLAKQVYEGDVGRQFGCRAWVSAAGKCAEEILEHLKQEIQEHVLSGQADKGNGVHENGIQDAMFVDHRLKSRR
ncbi:unnamed protein product [Urochloa humidicola]